jgi:hypothetical protein
MEQTPEVQREGNDRRPAVLPTGAAVCKLASRNVPSRDGTHPALGARVVA